MRSHQNGAVGLTTVVRLVLRVSVETPLSSATLYNLTGREWPEIYAAELRELEDAPQYVQGDHHHISSIPRGYVDSNEKNRTYTRYGSLVDGDPEESGNVITSWEHLQ